MSKQHRQQEPSKRRSSSSCSRNDHHTPFARNKHIQYFVHCLKLLPAQYSHLDTNRLTLVHFAVHSLDILGFFDDERNLIRYNVSKEVIIEWIYSLQITTMSSCSTSSSSSSSSTATGTTGNSNHESTKQIGENKFIKCCKELSPRRRNNDNNFDNMNISKHDIMNFENYEHVSFIGSTFLFTTDIHNCINNCNNCQEKGIRSVNNSNSKTKLYDQGHIAMTYTALCTLLALGDNLDHINKGGIIKSLKTLQQPDGSYQCRSSGSENDLRFLYCACAISYILNDWSGVNIQLAIEYIQSCKSYDGAYGLIPAQEGHGGSTFCAVACLVLMGVIDTELSGNDDDSFSARGELIQWCVTRQIKGMQGRPNKYEDTCYSYWIGGTLRLLECDDLLDKEALNDFVLGCQTDIGGFSKLECGLFPDLLHSFYSLAWLSIALDRRRNDNNSEQQQEDDDDDKELPSPVLNPLDCALGMCASRVDKFMLHGEGTDASTEYDSDDDGYSDQRNRSILMTSCFRCFRSTKTKFL